VVIYPNNWI